MYENEIEQLKEQIATFTGIIQFISEESLVGRASCNSAYISQFNQKQLLLQGFP